jgi:hypothetical protein
MMPIGIRNIMSGEIIFGIKYKVLRKPLTVDPHRVIECAAEAYKFSLLLVSMPGVRMC